MRGPLRERVNRRLLGIALAAAALGSTLLASVSGVCPALFTGFHTTASDSLDSTPPAAQPVQYR